MDRVSSVLTLVLSVHRADDDARLRDVCLDGVIVVKRCSHDVLTREQWLTIKHTLISHCLSLESMKMFDAKRVLDKS